jgi:hypothetical protein
MRPVLIISLPERIGELEAAATMFVHPRAAKHVKIFSIPAALPTRNATMLINNEAVSLKEAGCFRDCVILLDQEVKCNCNELKTHFDVVERHPYNKLRNQSHTQKGRPFLRKFLNSHGLCNLSYAQMLAEQWMHSSVNDNTIDLWLEQFDQFKCRWLGEKLLTLLYVMSAAEIGDVLTKLDDTDDENGPYCVLRDPSVSGKSGDVLSNLLRKRFKKRKIIACPSSFFDEALDGKLHIVEDGLWTATEIIGVLESILGLRAGTKKREKVKPLKDPSAFRSCNVVLHFAVTCDYGSQMLSLFLKRQQLANVQLSKPNDFFEVLSASGKKLLSAELDSSDPNELWAKGLPDGAVIPWIFGDANHNFWGKKLDRAHLVTQHLGEQLFTRYLERQSAQSGWTMWPQDKIRKCALGMWGLGLAFAFPHSIPKATLPVFWSYGKVDIEGKTLEWRPLFENAE